MNIEALARIAGIEGVDLRKLKVFADSVLIEHDNELKHQLSVAKSQNEIYKGVIYDSH
jgi:hypothetical protein